MAIPRREGAPTTWPEDPTMLAARTMTKKNRAKTTMTNATRKKLKKRVKMSQVEIWIQDSHFELNIFFHLLSNK